MGDIRGKEIGRFWAEGFDGGLQPFASGQALLAFNKSEMADSIVSPKVIQSGIIMLIEN